MKQYTNLITHLYERGEKRVARNNEVTFADFGLTFDHDMLDGFPLPTVKFVPFKSVMAELTGFIRGYTNAADFRELGTKIWDINANFEPSWLANPHRKGEDDLGPIYGEQWRRWQAPRQITAGGYTYWTVEEIDQLQNLIDGLIKTPFSRYHIVTAWNPATKDRVALPACHSFFQCFVGQGGYLDLLMYQRSADMALGVPFNIPSYAAMLMILAELTGLKARRLKIRFGDAHIYERHLSGVEEMLSRTPYNLPEGTCSRLQSIDDVKVDTIQIHGYDPHPAIKFVMAA